MLGSWALDALLADGQSIARLANQVDAGLNIDVHWHYVPNTYIQAIWRGDAGLS